MGDIDLKTKTLSKSEWQHSVISLKKDTIRKLEYNIARSQTYVEELYPIIHLFFSQLLRLDYNFTYSELIKDISTFEDEFELLFINEAKKKKLFDFLEKLIEFEYNKNDHTQDEIKKLFGEFMEIVKEYTQFREKNDDNKKSKSFFSFHKKEKKIEKNIEKQVSIEELKEKAMEEVIEENKPNYKDNNNRRDSTELKEEEHLQEIEVGIKEQFDKLLIDTREAIKTENHTKAKRMYHHLREVFIELPEEEKKDYKKELWNIYNKLNNK